MCLCCGQTSLLSEAGSVHRYPAEAALHENPDAIICAGTAPGATCGGCSAMRCWGRRCCGAMAAAAWRWTQPGVWHTFTPAASCTGVDCRMVLTHQVEYFRMEGMQTADTAGTPPQVIMELCQRCRDIKSSNILLDGSGRAKVADVGLACHLDTVGLNAPEGTFVSVSVGCNVFATQS